MYITSFLVKWMGPKISFNCYWSLAHHYLVKLVDILVWVSYGWCFVRACKHNCGWICIIFIWRALLGENGFLPIVHFWHQTNLLHVTIDYVFIVQHSICIHLKYQANLTLHPRWWFSSCNLFLLLIFVLLWIF